MLSFVDFTGSQKRWTGSIGSIGSNPYQFFIVLHSFSLVPFSFFLSSDPESHPKVGFESVSGFGFRVSSIETNFRCRFRVSGFGFRCLKPTFAVGFGFRVSGFVD